MTDLNFDPFAGGEIQRVCPTTGPQQEVITSSKMSDEANTAFNESVALTLKGTVDTALLETCCNILIRRHDILRATFSSLGDEICLQEARYMEVPYEDLRAYEEEVKQKKITELFSNIAISPMNLEEGPLFYAWLKQLGDEHFELIIAVHHVVCDGWSFGLLLTELADLYRSGGDDNALPAAPSYFDFAEQQAAAQVSNADIDYWVDRFQELPQALDLPLDKIRPPLRSFSADRYDYRLSDSLVLTLPKAASSQKSSLVNYVLAGYFALLYRLTGNGDIVVGLPVAGQAALKRLKQVGHMVQLLPIRVQLNDETSFSDLVSIIKQEVLNAGEHPSFTFGQLLENFTVERSRVPLVNTIFNIDQPMPVLDFGTASAIVRSVPRAAENFEIFLNIMPSKDALVLEATYSTALFSEGTIISWMKSLEAILQVVVNEPDIAISEIPLCQDVPELIHEINQTSQAIQFPDVVTAFDVQVKLQPDAVAVISGGNQLSYRELDLLSTRVAVALSLAGVESDSVIGICCERSSHLLIAALAVLKLGAAYLPLDPDFPAGRLLYMLEDSDAVAILEDGAAPEAVVNARLTHIDINEAISKDSDVSIELPGPSASRLAYTIYTSGSTGKPKGVRVQNSAMINFLESMAHEPGCSKDDILLAVTTLSFDISILELFLPLVVGATSLIADREEVKSGDLLAKLIKQYQVSMMQATPGTWYMLLASQWPEQTDSGGRRLKALCGGEPMPPDLAVGLLPHVSELWNMFGPTETTVWSTCKKIESTHGVISVGKPIANTQVYILDEKLNALPISMPGELCIAGSGVTLGYYKRPELNQDRFYNHPKYGRMYRTGDLAKCLPSGDIHHLGRIDDQVKLRGYRIELGEIEAALKSCDGVEQVAVYLWTIDEQDVRVVACCVPQQGSVLETIKIRKQIRELLPGYMVPQYFLSIDNIPVTPNGKVDRRALPRPEVAESSILGKKVLQTDAEKMIAKVWMDLLKFSSEIGREDNFFELGGHSLLALQVIRQIEIVSGVRLKPADMVSGRLSTLAEKISSATTVQQGNTSMPKPLAQSARRRLSLDQLKLLERQLTLPESTCNNLPAAWILEGDMNVSAFVKSIERVVERQTALRTIIDSDAEGYRLVLQHTSEREIPEYVDYSVKQDPMEEALEDARCRGLQPFKVIKQPLCNIVLYKIAENKHLLFINVHQLIFDGWSFDILLRELEACYKAALDKRTAALDSLAFQFRDYSDWSVTRKPDETILAYHRKSLEREQCPVKLIKSTKKAHLDRKEMLFESAALEKMMAFCDEGNIRIHELLFAFFTIAFAKAEGRDRLLIGLPVSGRYIPETIGLVGSFVSTLPFEVNLRVGHLAEVVHDVAEQLRVFYDHQEISFAELVANTPLEKEIFPACLPVSFAFQDIRARPQSMADLKMVQVDMPRKQAELPLEYWVRVQSDGFLCVFDYDAGQIDEVSVNTIAQGISTLVDELANNSDISYVVTGSGEKSSQAKPFWRRLFQ